MSSFYNVEIKCDNCGFSGVADLVKGTKVNDNKCPNCGCNEIHRKGKDSIKDLKNIQEIIKKNTWKDIGIRPTPFEIEQIKDGKYKMFLLSN